MYLTNHLVGALNDAVFFPVFGDVETGENMRTLLIRKEFNCFFFFFWGGGGADSPVFNAVNSTVRDFISKIAQHCREVQNILVKGRWFQTNIWNCAIYSLLGGDNGI